MTLDEALAEKLREYLAETGMSQRGLGRRLGVTQGAVSMLLSGQRRRHQLTFYEDLARAMGLTLSALLSEVEAAMSPVEEPPESLARFPFE